MDSIDDLKLKFNLKRARLLLMTHSGAFAGTIAILCRL